MNMPTNPPTNLPKKLTGNSARDPLRLSTLAAPLPPADSWPAISTALQRSQSQRRRISWAAAAAVALIAGSTAWQFRAPMPAPPEAAVTPQVAVQAPPSQQAASSVSENNLALLVGLSQQLESKLRTARTRVLVMPAQSLAYQVEIEDLIAQVDEAINQDPNSLELWSQRVNLLLDLNQIYGTELRRDYGSVASL